MRIDDNNPILEDLSKSLIRSEVAFFVGAGLSYHSGLPLVSQLIPSILEELKVSEKQAEQIKMGNLPFEAFVEALLRGGPIDALIELFLEGRPNRNHILLARLAKMGVVRTICTTNFDLLIERALETEGLKRSLDFEVIFNEGDFQNHCLNSDTIIRIFKIHGSAEEPESVVTTLRRIASRSLSASRNRVIEYVFSRGPHQQVLVFGYSCSDIFDIVPQIAAIRESQKNVLMIEHMANSYRSRMHDSDIVVTKMLHGKGPFLNFPGGTLVFDTDMFIQSIWERVIPQHWPTVEAPAFAWQDYINTWGLNQPEVAKQYIIGNLLRHTGNYLDAVPVLEGAIKSSKRTQDHSLQSKLYGNLGTCFRALAEYRRAQKAFQDGLDIANKANDIAKQGQFLGDLGSVYRSLGQYKKALEYQRKALLLVRKVGNTELVAIIHANIGNTFHMLGRYREAVNHHRKAAKGASEFGDKRTEALTQGNLGAALLMIGNTEGAKISFETAIELAKDLGDSRTLLTSLSNLATVMELQGRLKDAVNMYEEAKQIAQATKQRKLKAAIQSNLSALWRTLGDYNLSASCAREALFISEEIGDEHTKIRALGNHGMALIYLNEKEKAYQDLTKALKAAINISDKRGEAIQLRNLAEFHFHYCNHGIAADYCNKSITISREIGVKQSEARALYWRGKVTSGEEGKEFLEKALSIFLEIGAKNHPEALEVQRLLSKQKSL